jgi:DNA-binding response OmpR family regulator
MAIVFPILLVDDDPNIADILNRAAKSRFAEAEFIHVHSFVEAASYLEGLQGRGPRLVIVDLDLQSDLTGLDFITLMRGHPQGRLVPTIVLSASQDQVKAMETYIRGANSFTTKPFSYEDWKTYVSELRAYWFETVTTPTLWFDYESPK